MKERVFFVEAESFEDLGGWVLETQFIEIMGSPYLMAHGLGNPVKDATTTVIFPDTGHWRVWVRTKDWVAQWRVLGQPGQFKMLINGKPLEVTFGTEGEQWHWQDGGVISIDKTAATLALHDLTGFNGRCDAICFSQDLNGGPPQDDYRLQQWKQESIRCSEQPECLEMFGLVVTGGGYAGMCAAIAAARMGVKVALIQDRPVLGGNASSEIRVPLRGLIEYDSPYSRVGEIVDELQYDKRPDATNASKCDDFKYEGIVRAEQNIALYMNHHVVSVEMEDDYITEIVALDTREGILKRIKGRLFADCTGHGMVGALAGADYNMDGKDHMGMSNLWCWERADTQQTFPDTPWALELTISDFPIPCPGNITCTWCWESGFNRDPINDLEYIRDWNLRAVFGAWNAMKNKDEKKEYANARLTWLSAFGGTRESRRLLGDIIFTEDHMLNHVKFDDGFVPVTWFLDRHIPDERYSGKYRDDPFIASALHKPGTRREDRPRHDNPYWGVPYRCLYSRNVKNLFMAGRDISTTFWALSAVRVMRTCGMMGEVVGKAASICIKKDCRPREVYHLHLDLLKQQLM